MARTTRQRLRGKLAGAPLLMLVLTTASARVLLVPESYPTINGAVTESIAEDTILVNRGIYPEQLWYPSHRIYVMSHYELTHDTLDVMQTVIEGYSYADHDTATIALFLPGAADSSKLCGFTLQGGSGIDQRGCCGAFLADSCSPVICHNLIAHNSSILSAAGEFWYCSGEFRDNRVWDNDHGNQPLRVCYNLYSDPVIVEGNVFGTNPANPDAVYPGISLAEGSRSIVRGNVLRGLTGQSVLAIIGYEAAQISICNNWFDSLNVSGYASGIVTLWSKHSDVVVTDNVFSNSKVRDAGALEILNYTPTVNAQVEGNIFENISPLDSFSGQATPGVWLQYCSGVIRNNIFRNLAGNFGSAVYFSQGGNPSGLTIEYNLFENCSTAFQWPNVATITRAAYNGAISGHYNIFRHNYPRVVTWDDVFPGRIADFTLNYWGDPSGPHHPVLNPNGLGDAVGDSVLFDPWLTDSNVSVSPQPLTPLPTASKLECFPNPFNPTTRLKFSVAEPGRYRMELYDLTGRKVRDIFEGAVVIDREVTLNADDLPSGVYFARAMNTTSKRSVATAKLVLLK